MGFAFLLTLLAACFLTGFGLRALRMRSLKSWVYASLVAPALMIVMESLEPTGWLPVALFFGTVYGVIAGGVGVLLGWVITRESRDYPAS
jgi:hypothetical protein